MLGRGGTPLVLPRAKSDREQTDDVQDGDGPIRTSYWVMITPRPLSRALVLALSSCSLIVSFRLLAASSFCRLTSVSIWAGAPTGPTLLGFNNSLFPVSNFSSFCFIRSKELGSPARAGSIHTARPVHSRETASGHLARLIRDLNIVIVSWTELPEPSDISIPIRNRQLLRREQRDDPAALVGDHHLL